LRAIIECPAKTINSRREDHRYQVDTGPIVFPDLSVEHDRYVDGIFLAYLAFNAPNFADFVLEVPTTVGEDEQTYRVHHYSKLVSFEARNTLWSIES
jgi:hypothetical protein